MKYALSQEGADSLSTLAATILNSVSDALEAGNRLKKAVEGDVDRLGPYGSTIMDIASLNLHTISSSWDDLKELALLLETKADAIREICGQLEGGPGGDSSSGGFVKTRRFSRSEQMERYKSGLLDIDDQLSFLRQDLIEQGIPEGEWLDSVINEQSEMMKVNLSNDLERARGNSVSMPSYPEPSVSAIVERYRRENNGEAGA